MSVSTTGAEFKKYHEDPVAWPEGQYYDDVVLEVDGARQADGVDTDLLDDSATVTIVSGYVCSEHGGNVGSLESHFKKWKKAQDAVVFLVSCDKAHLQAVRAAIAAAGGVIA